MLVTVGLGLPCLVVEASCPVGFLVLGPVVNETPGLSREIIIASGETLPTNDP